ncbi:MAG: DUF1294 domain-containing protein [Xanthomonadales bacterium]|nr:DUF1294 domain-containing protein [Xanthomonadales bacterium]
MSQRFAGQLTEWRDEQGFGFITTNGSHDRVFVHINDMTGRRRRPAVGDRLLFRLATDDRDRYRAVDVSYAKSNVRPTKGNGANAALLLFAATFLAVLGVSVFTERLPPIVGLIYFAMSMLAFGFYAMDKSAAVNGRQRTRESTLILLGLLGGWPGALLAQQWLRHKSSKKSFQFDFWLSVIVNLFVAGWLFTEAGARAAAKLQGVVKGLVQ